MSAPSGFLARRAVRHYEYFMDHVVVPALGNVVTYDDQLREYGTELFKKKFHGVYMRDRIPRTFSRARPYGVLNLDKFSEPGSHWIAVAYLGPGCLLVYDSFGAQHKVPQELLHVYPLSETTDPDAEQLAHEDNCGARVMAWLLVFHKYGPAEAKKI